MRRFLALPLVLLAFVTLAAASCSSSDDGDSAARSSNERESGESSDSSSGDDSDSSADSDGGTGIEEELGSLLDEAQESVTSLLEQADEAMGGVGECVDLNRAFGKLQTSILGGSDGTARAQEAAEELKDLVPEELSGDVDVIADALSELSEQGSINGSTALSSTEYEEAMQAVTDYLLSECGLS